MPHFGHMKPDMPPADAALLRARLHLRCGRRRIIEKKAADGIATLYDAMLSGIHWFALTKGAEHEWVAPENEALPDDAELIKIIKKSAPGIGPDLNILKKLAGEAIGGRVPEFDSEAILQLIDRVMTRLEILPFDETLLPPEDQETF